MVNENNGAGVTPENDTQGTEIDFSNTDAVKEAFEQMTTKQQDLAEKNKQLFARAKKAEGFVEKDGEWVKPEPKEAPKEKPKSFEKPTETNPQPSELDYGQLAFHNTKSDAVKVEHAEDVQFLKDQMAETGKGQEALLNSNWFKAELQERMSARESQASVPKGKGRSGQTGITDVDVAVAKYKETGEIPQDFETRSKVFNKLAEQEKTGNVFSGPSVFGPRPQ